MKRSSTRWRRGRHAAAISSLVFACLSVAWTASTQEPEPNPSIPPPKIDPNRVMGTQSCKECHAAEIDALHASDHHVSIRELPGRDAASKFAKELGIDPKGVGSDLRCGRCHGTVACLPNGRFAVVSGVSCESCHGASGGSDGWHNAHGSYGFVNARREQESPQHRESRFEFCQRAGMKWSAYPYELARACFECHLVDDEPLVNAGHPLTDKAGFEYVSWSQGEVRHNFHVDSGVNAEIGSLLVERTGSDPSERRRVLYVLGQLADFEMSVRRWISAEDPDGDFARGYEDRVDDRIGATLELLEDAGVDEMAPDLYEAYVEVTDDGGAFADELDEEQRVRLFETIEAIGKAFSRGADGKSLEDFDTLIPDEPRGEVYRPGNRDGG